MVSKAKTLIVAALSLSVGCGEYQEESSPAMSSSCEELRIKAYGAHIIDKDDLARLRSSGLAPLFDKEEGLYADVICEEFGLSR